jgi:peptidoglycan hydrolase CwlO-like protein
MGPENKYDVPIAELKSGLQSVGNEVNWINEHLKDHDKDIDELKDKGTRMEMTIGQHGQDIKEQKVDLKETKANSQKMVKWLIATFVGILTLAIGVFLNLLK